MATPALCRTTLANLPWGTGLGTAAEASRQFARIGDWQIAWGGAYQRMGAEIGWRWVFLSLLLGVTGLVQYVLKTRKGRSCREKFGTVLLGGCMVSTLGAMLADVRLHLLLSPLPWLVLGLVSSQKRAEPETASPRSALEEWLTRHRSILVGTRSFLLSLITLIFLLSLNRAIRSDLGELHYRKALHIRENEDSTRAEVLTELFAASQWSPSDGRVDYEIARVLLQSFDNGPSSPGAQERRNAQIALERAIEKSPVEADYRGLLAQTLFLDGNMSGALETYKSAVRVDPGNPFWRRELGGIYETLGQLEEAEKNLRVLCDLQPHLGEPRYNLARVLARQGKTAEAAGLYQAALEINPELIQLLRTTVR